MEADAGVGRRFGAWGSVAKKAWSPSLALGLLGAGVLICQFRYLTRFPPVFIDEPWYADAAWTWLRTGVNLDSMHAGSRPDVVWPMLGNLPWLASFALLGLGLFQARLVSWVFGGLLLLATFLVGRRAYGAPAGALAALFLVLSDPFLQASHYVRPDIMLSLVGLLALFSLMVAVDTGRWWCHALAGLLITLSLDIHPNGILFGMGVAAIYLVQYGRRVFKDPGPRWMVGGALLGAVYYAAVVGLASSASFVGYFRFSLGVTHRIPLLEWSLPELLRSLRAEVGRFHFAENDLAFVLIGAAMAYLAYRRRPTDKRLLAHLLTVFAGFVLFVGNKHDIYAILLYPYMMIASAAAIVGLLAARETTAPGRVFLYSLLGLTVFSGMFSLARTLGESSGYRYEAITDRIRQAVPRGSRVMGLPHWWLGLSDYDYRSSLSLSYYNVYQGYSLTEGLEAIRPDVLIVDDGWRGLLVDEGFFEAEGFGIFNMPREEFEGFLESQAERLAEFSDRWHGRFTIYRIRWEQPGTLSQAALPAQSRASQRERGGR